LRISSKLFSRCVDSRLSLTTFLVTIFSKRVDSRSIIKLKSNLHFSTSAYLRFILLSIIDLKSLVDARVKGLPQFDQFLLILFIYSFGSRKSAALIALVLRNGSFTLCIFRYSPSSLSIVFLPSSISHRISKFSKFKIALFLLVILTTVMWTVLIINYTTYWSRPLPSETYFWKRV